MVELTPSKCSTALTAEDLGVSERIERGHLGAQRIERGHGQCLVPVVPALGVSAAPNLFPENFAALGIATLAGTLEQRRT